MWNKIEINNKVSITNESWWKGDEHWTYASNLSLVGFDQLCERILLVTRFVNYSGSYPYSSILTGLNFCLKSFRFWVSNLMRLRVRHGIFCKRTTYISTRGLNPLTIFNPFLKLICLLTGGRKQNYCERWMLPRQNLWIN